MSEQQEIELLQKAILLEAENETLRDRLAALEEENGKLREALRFYADKRRYNGPNQKVEWYDDQPDKYQPDNPYLQDVTRDNGAIAAAALAGAAQEGASH